MKENLKSTSLAWKKIAYMWKKYFTVPSRVSGQEARTYRKWLRDVAKGKAKQKALVLGATPEIREALYDLGYEVYCIDINKDMFLAMNDLIKNKNKNETLITANWLDNNLKLGFFDVVVGDAVLPNIPWKERKKLLLWIKNLLKPNGFFLTRAFYAPENKRFKNLKEVLNNFKRKKTSVKQCALEMVLELHYLSYDHKDHLGSFAKAKEIIEKNKDIEISNKRLKRIYEIVKTFWCKDFVNKVFIYAYRSEEEEEYRKSFEIKDCFEAKDHEYSKLTPMYLLIKK